MEKQVSESVSGESEWRISVWEGETVSESVRVRYALCEREGEGEGE